MSPLEKIDKDIAKAQKEYADEMVKIKAIEVRLSELRKERENADYLIRMGAGDIVKRRHA